MKEKNSEKVIYYSRMEKGYPDKLRQYENMPSGIYVKGKLPDSRMPAVAIVGARKCSGYGRMQADSFARAFAASHVAVISGMAMGIDSAAHQGALRQGGETYAVFGCGADICYPASNRALYAEILQKGGVITEYPPRTAPLSWHFPARNRIISALADAVLVIEAKEKSGSLITADFALEQGKPVYALPGRVGDALSEGCNRLIAQGAGIALSPAVILEELQLQMTAGTLAESEMLEADEHIILNLLQEKADGFYGIQTRSGFPVSKLTGILMKLQLKGFIYEQGKTFNVRKK